MTHDEMIAVIAAHRDGKKIECRQTEAGRITNEVFSQASLLMRSELVRKGAATWENQPISEWKPKTGNLFDFISWEYRILAEPREWEIRINKATGNGEVQRAGKNLHVSGYEIVTVREVL